MINKTIHYCWFGKKPLPESAKKCINSWKKYFPSYEIKQWDENNFDFHCIPYVQEAYEAKKWAFVSDYARFWILYTYGGLYFDTDVEVIKSFDDLLLSGAFMGCEPSQKYGNAVNAGLGLAAEAKMDIYREILSSYENAHFIKKNGDLDLTTVVERVTDILVKRGFDPSKNKAQKIMDVTIYTTDFFCPMNYYTGELFITDNTHSIHRYNASWHSEREKYAYNLYRQMNKKLPNKMADRLSFVISILKYNGACGLINEIHKRVKGDKNE